MSEELQTLTELLQRSVEQFGDRTALITEEQRLTYRELSALVDRYARSLVAQGVGKGTRLGLLMENSPEWIAMAFAATSLGAIFVPISTFVKPGDLAFQLNHADISHLFLNRSFLKSDYLAMLLEVVPELTTADSAPLYANSTPCLRQVTVKGEGELPAAVCRWDDFEAAAERIPAALLAPLRAQLDGNDDCYMLSTSGTTSRPKGVLQTHHAVARNGWLIGEYQQLVCEDVVWFYFPMFFSAGCVNVMLGTLSHGAALIVHSNFEPAAALKMIEQERATAWHLFPPTLKKLMTHPDWQSRDHSRLHKGTAPYDVLLGMQSPSGQGGVNMYGMTETCTAFTCTRADEAADIRVGTQGHLMPGNAMKIINPDTGASLPQGEVGEICVKGPSVLKRYYKLPPQDYFDSDGFFYTGDLGKINAEGRLHYLQRAKDMIKSSGINISPAEIEEKLASIDGVAEAFAFPVPCEEKDEIVGLALVMKPGVEPKQQSELVAFCQQNLPSYKRPCAVLFMAEAEVPMTGSGKVQKNQIKDRFVKAYNNDELMRL
jgi:fatty-acyl-CoA synthase